MSPVRGDLIEAAVTQLASVFEDAAQTLAAMPTAAGEFALVQLLGMGAEESARILVAQLVSGDGDAAAAAANDVGEADPHSGEPGWWGTPLGLLVAASVGPDGVDLPVRAVTSALGLSRARVYQLVDEGLLTRGTKRGTVSAHSVALLLSTRGLVRRWGFEPQV